MEKILTRGERNTLSGMAVYWREVREREDTSPLEHEIQQVYRMLGVRLLNIVEAYLKSTKEEVSE